MRDRLSFVRFLGLALEDKLPDAKTVWLYREHFRNAGNGVGHFWMGACRSSVSRTERL